MKNNFWLWILFFAAIFLYTFNLGELSLRDWDEGIVATVAREIYRAKSGDFTWLYPQNLDGTPYWNKPPLIHNLIAFSYQLLGVNEWSTRLIPRIISALSVPLLYLIGREIFSTKNTALIAAFVYLTLIPVVRHNRLAMLDGAITSEFCFAIWCLLRLRFKQNKNLLFKSLYLLGIGFSFSLLSLTKGIAIAFLLFCLFFLFILTEIKSFSLIFSWQAITIIIAGFSPAIVWYFLQYLNYGSDFITYNLGQQTFNRVINTVENNHAPFWYYVLELTKYSLPWLFFLPGGIKLAIQQRNTLWAKLALIWFCCYLGAISLMTTKLPWYLIPLYPAFALLVGSQLQKIFDLQQVKLFQNIAYQKIFIILSIIFSTATIYYTFISQTKDANLSLIALILATTFAVTGILINKSRYFFLSLTVGLYLALLIFVQSPHAIWELAEAYSVKPVAKLIKANTPAKTTVYTTYPYYRPSLNFYSDRLVIPLSESQLQAILLQKQRIYLLKSSNTPQLPDNQIIQVQGEWQIIITN